MQSLPFLFTSLLGWLQPGCDGIQQCDGRKLLVVKIHHECPCRHECFGAPFHLCGCSAIVLIDVPGTSPADGAMLLHSDRRHYCLVGGHVDASCDVFRSKLFKASGLQIWIQQISGSIGWEVSGGILDGKLKNGPSDGRFFKSFLCCDLWWKNSSGRVAIHFLQWRNHHRWSTYAKDITTISGRNCKIWNVSVKLSSGKILLLESVFSVHYHNLSYPMAALIAIVGRDHWSRCGTCDFFVPRSGKFHVALQLLRRCLLPAAVVFLMQMDGEFSRVACLLLLAAN